MTPSEAQEEMDELGRRLRRWLTEMWMRHAEAPVDDLAASSCTFCRGSGRAHFCISGCEAPPDQECLHPTLEEKRKLNAIRDELMMLRNRIQIEVEKELREVLLPKGVATGPRSERMN